MGQKSTTRRHSSSGGQNQYAARTQRIEKEIEDLEHCLFKVNAKDAGLRYENLRTFRVEIQRSFVLSLHLAIEDLLHALLFDFLAQQNPRLTKKETIKIVRDMRSAELVHWCGRLKLITPTQYRDLLDLNRIRNACAHNWILDVPRFKQVGRPGSRKRIRVPTVSYRDRNLFSRNTFLDEFLPKFSGIYLKLLSKVWKMQGKIQ